MSNRSGNSASRTWCDAIAAIAAHLKHAGCSLWIQAYWEEISMLRWNVQQWPLRRRSDNAFHPSIVSGVMFGGMS